MIGRRDFITLLGGAAAWPVAARAQQPERMRRIGVLIGVAGDAETKAWVATFRKRLDELGWKGDDNLKIEERWTAGDPEQNRTFAGELLAMKPDAIFAFSSVAVAALQRESRAVPIVFTAISDPVGSGFVASFAHPGGNATGFTNFVPTMAAKWLEVLKDIVPQLRRAVLLFNPQTAPYVPQYYRGCGCVVRCARFLNRPPVRRHRLGPCHHPQARAHDGRRRDGDERVREGIGLYPPPPRERGAASQGRDRLKWQSICAYRLRSCH
jgi:ABC transporter substrate binding protein